MSVVMRPFLRFKLDISNERNCGSKSAQYIAANDTQKLTIGVITLCAFAPVENNCHRTFRQYSKVLLTTVQGVRSHTDRTQRANDRTNLAQFASNTKQFLPQSVVNYPIMSRTLIGTQLQTMAGIVQRQSIVSRKGHEYLQPLMPLFHPSDQQSLFAIRNVVNR